jgi:hypothetical protein
MRRAQAARIRGEGIVLLLIILAILAGGVWFVYSSRQAADENCRAFAALVAERVAVHYDDKFLHVRLGPDAQKKFLQSVRDRLMARFRALGTPAQPIQLEGNVVFQSGFFKPMGTFRAELKYPSGVAYLDLTISSGMTVWQVDDIYLTEPPLPKVAPAAAQTAAPIAAATPTPTPEQKPRRKRKR